METLSSSTTDTNVLVTKMTTKPPPQPEGTVLLCSENNRGELRSPVQDLLHCLQVTVTHLTPPRLAFLHSVRPFVSILTVWLWKEISEMPMQGAALGDG